MEHPYSVKLSKLVEDIIWRFCEKDRDMKSVSSGPMILTDQDCN